jgi:putative transposase
MTFETGDLYHIYNQGNDRVRIFFLRENFLFFLNKIKEHVLPHADILAWCLMPNHFHLMVYLHTMNIEISKKGDGMHSGRRKFLKREPIIEPFTFNGLNNPGLFQSDDINTDDINNKRERDFNNSIGLLLRSYTRAIQKQEKMTGSLFRKSTHAECLTKMDLHTPSFFNTSSGTLVNQHFPEEEYPQVCFNYIHNNPVKSGLVKHPEDWEFSSYRDYCGLRNGKLINRKRAEEFGLFI